MGAIDSDCDCRDAARLMDQSEDQTRQRVLLLLLVMLLGATLLHVTVADRAVAKNAHPGRRLLVSATSLSDQEYVFVGSDDQTALTGQWRPLDLADVYAVMVVVGWAAAIGAGAIMLIALPSIIGALGRKVGSTMWSYSKMTADCQCSHS